MSIPKIVGIVGLAVVLYLTMSALWSGVVEITVCEDRVSEYNLLSLEKDTRTTGKFFLLFGSFQEDAIYTFGYCGETGFIETKEIACDDVSIYFNNEPLFVITERRCHNEFPGLPPRLLETHWYIPKDYEAEYAFLLPQDWLEQIGL